MDKFRFKLYVAGDGDLSQRALINLKKACETLFHGRYEIEVIDVLKNREAARQDRVLATPMTVKFQPEPEVRLIGDLSDSGHFARVLGISEKCSRSTETGDAASAEKSNES